MPLGLVLPSTASPKSVLIISMNRSAGVTSTRTTAVAVLSCHQSCQRPAATSTASPAASVLRTPSRLTPRLPSSTSKRSGIAGCRCSPATAPPGATCSS